MITNRLMDLGDRRATRLAFAHDLFDKLVREEFYATNRRALEEVVRSAQREDYVYAHLLGEPMPEHLRAALATEVSEWTGFYEILVRKPVPEDQYAILCARLRPRAVALMDLLDVEMEMLTNPLVRHYQDWLRAYRSR
jgi:hypothetical protein